MSERPPWTFGVELELLAPRGATRADVAAALGAPVRRVWHLDSEPSRVPGQPIFHNLTAAFEVGDPARPLARVTDDLTLLRDLDRHAPPKPGWYRVVSDDVRLLRLVARHADPDASLDAVLQPLCALTGGAVTLASGGLRRLEDPFGSPLALAAPLPGERERGAELALAPAMAFDILHATCDRARAAGCVVPHEAAVHVHVDGAALADAATLHHLARWLDGREAWLRSLVRTNPACVRLGPWSDALRGVLLDPDFAALSWPDAVARLQTAGVSKYVDMNLRNLVHPFPGKHTVEWRIFPGTLDAEQVVLAVRLFDALVQAARERRPAPPEGAGWLRALPLAPDALAAWLTRCP